MATSSLRKGELTRQAIVEHAARMASRIGLEGLTIGALAEELKLSKSGLFAHFKSKEALQLQALEFGIGRFVDTVVRPALAAPRGEPRVRALFERWVDWPRASGLAGCMFVALSTELDDRPGGVGARPVLHAPRPPRLAAHARVSLRSSPVRRGRRRPAGCGLVVGRRPGRLSPPRVGRRGWPARRLRPAPARSRLPGGHVRRARPWRLGGPAQLHRALR